MVAIPNYKGFLAEDLTQSLLKLFTYQPKEGEPKIGWGYSISKGCPVLPRVRNHMIFEMLNGEFDGILFVDDDIGFDAEDVYRMIGRGYGLIGAVPQKRSHKWNDPPTLAVSPMGMQFFKTEEGYDIGVPMEPKLPMACTFIAAQVFRDLIEMGKIPQYIYTPSSGQKALCHQFFGYELVPAPDWSYEFAVGKELGVESPLTEDGEDHYFCRRAAEAGYESLVDLRVGLRHWEGQVCHDYSFKQYLAENGGLLDVKTVDAQVAA